MRTALATTVLLVACSGPAAREVTGDDADVTAVVAGTNAFTLDVYQEVAAGADRNVFVSPFSMAAALSMAYAGAAGDTATEMEDVLHVDTSADHHGGFGALVRDLDGDKRRGYALHVANRIWGQDGVGWKEPFLAINAEDYAAPTELRDIGADPEGTRAEVNAWVEEQTENRIEELFKPGEIDSTTLMVLANAIYFKADWAEAFDPARTKDEAFTRLDGSTVDTALMHGAMEGRVATGDGFVVASLPYESEEVSLWVVVPEATDGLPTIEAELDSASLTTLMDQATYGDLEVTLPKVEVHTGLGLKPTLSALGMPSAFDPSAADFSGMTEDAQLYIGTAVHQAWVAIDEEGTEAAAATGLGMNELSASIPVEVVVDHPYLFVIRDELTGAFLFIGRVVDPTSRG